MQHNKYTEGEELSAEELETISAELIQAKFDRDQRNAWTKRLKEDYNVERETVQKNRFVWSKLAIAATIACVLGIVTYSIVLFTAPSYDEVVTNYIENLNSIDNHTVVTRGDTTFDTQIAEAITAYKAKQYVVSIQRWEAILDAGKISGFANYNIALCYLQKTPSSPQKAIEYLLEAKKTKVVQQEANWALALVYLDINQKEKAKEILQNIIQAKAYKYKKAEKLLALL